MSSDAADSDAADDVGAARRLPCGRRRRAAVRDALRVARQGRPRPGEAFALQPGDVDFGQDVMRAIRGHLTWLKTDGLRRGRGEPEWLFPNVAGRPFDTANVERAYRIRKTRRPAALPALRPAPHVREPAARRGRADYLRQHATRPRQSDDDAAVLRQVDSDQGAALGHQEWRYGGRTIRKRPSRQPERAQLGHLVWR